jgi:hypothetical protein
VGGWVHMLMEMCVPSGWIPYCAISLDVNCDRPHVVFNPKTNLFVMWFEDRGPGLSGYTIATSVTPGGPFQAQVSPHIMCPLTAGQESNLLPR